MLNIYEYINSRDVREYLKSTGYKFTLPQAAFIIYICRSLTLEDKFWVWMQLIDEKPDCVFEGSLYRKYIESFHEFLIEYIALQKKKLQLFFDSGDGGRYACYEERDDWDCLRKKRFSDFDSCRDYYCNVEKERMGSGNIRFVKEGLGDRTITVVMNSQLQVLEVTVPHNTSKTWQVGYVNDLLSETEYKTDDVFEMMYFAFPVPFRRGDILGRCEQDKNPSSCQYHDFYVVSEKGIELCKKEEEGEATIEDYIPLVYCFGFPWRSEIRIGLGTGPDLWLNLEKREPPSTLEGNVVRAYSNWIKGQTEIEIFIDTYNNYLSSEKRVDNRWVYQVKKSNVFAKHCSNINL